MDAKEHSGGDADFELIRRYVAGDDIAFDILYEKYKRPLYAYLNRLLPGQCGVADDLFQQTWLKVIAALPGYECRQRFLSWMLRIAHNLTIDKFRHQDRDLLPLPDGIEDTLSSDTEPWVRMERRELALVLEKALDTLAPELREVFVLRLENVSFKEIAEIQGCSINTALGRMQYAMKNLQREMRKTEYAGGS